MEKDEQDFVGAAAPIDLAVALESACWDLDFLVRSALCPHDSPLILYETMIAHAHHDNALNPTVAG